MSKLAIPRSNLAPGLNDAALEAAIFKTYEVAQKPRHSNRLGASLIGQACQRRIWLTWRWAFPPERFEGRILRLFETGSREEERILRDLSRAMPGASFATQVEFTACGGHAVAKLDGLIANSNGAITALEIKTHNDKSFKALQKSGVLVAKPEHHAQLTFGAQLAGAGAGLYVAVNKNTDELYVERVDARASSDLLDKAKQILFTDFVHAPPPRLADGLAGPSKKALWDCNYCPAAGVCLGEAAPQRNCRTCLHATVIKGGETAPVARWDCAKHAIERLGLDTQEAGCSEHRFLPWIVPSADFEATAAGLEYILPSGDVWVDVGGENAPL